MTTETIPLTQGEGVGASAKAEQALVSDQARSGLDPTGFDPSRVGDRIKMAVMLAPHLEVNAAGELLRGLSFVGGYGAYSTFDLIEGFEPAELDLLVRTALAGCWAKDPTTISQMRGFVHGESGLTVAWYWDGDGSLVFKGDNLFLYNGDCKKDHEWEASGPGDWIHTYEHYETNENYPSDSDASLAENAQRSSGEAVAARAAPAASPETHIATALKGERA